MSIYNGCTSHDKYQNNEADSFLRVETPKSPVNRTTILSAKNWQRTNYTFEC